MWKFELDFDFPSAARQRHVCTLNLVLNLVLNLYTEKAGSRKQGPRVGLRAPEVPETFNNLVEVKKVVEAEASKRKVRGRDVGENRRNRGKSVENQGGSGWVARRGSPAPIE